jgi:hypothetical protein
MSARSLQVWSNRIMILLLTCVPATKIVSVRIQDQITIQELSREYHRA